ncbi:hypothetical protein Y032_0033g2651 [Ancylostoma ceylanicum]|uniref:Uncharacterized protein n=1 Tax=Ancylostoma ceylanicum TaxID=53326 RepID=A0A016UM02_9BILA|nr:hypothetical protein Y032_0033g2651 [Ancylostoma ceylanicum]
MPIARKSTNSTKTTKAAQTTSELPPPLTSKTSEKEQVISQLQAILEVKAPEALPLLNQLLQLSRIDPREIVETEKRSRSIVISGVAEAEGDLSPSERLAHTEAAVNNVLDVLGVEARPSEVYRMGALTEGKPRLIKCVLPSAQFYSVALRNARSLRSISGFDHIFVRRSMTREEREKDRDLRRQVRELNDKDHHGNRVFVVYRNQIVKASEIPKLKHSASKNF